MSPVSSEATEFHLGRTSETDSGSGAPDMVLHQAFFGWREDARQYTLLSSSLADGEAELWAIRLLLHVRFVPAGADLELPERAFSYLTFGDGTAAVVRLAERGHSFGRNNAHVLIGDARLLDVHLSMVLFTSWQEWREEFPPHELAPIDVPRIWWNLPPLKELASIADELVVVLSRLLVAPEMPLSVVGVPAARRLALVRGLFLAAGGYLKETGFERRWTYATSDQHGASAADLPEIVFHSAEPDPIRVHERAVVRLDLPEVSQPRLDKAKELVTEMLSTVQGGAAPEEGSHTRPGRKPGEPVRRVLSIGVRGFDHDAELEFAPALARELARTFIDLEYDAEWITRERMSSEELGGQVKRVLAEGVAHDVAVVHLVTHGVRGDGGGTVYVLGSDGKQSGEADIANWLNTQQTDDRPMTLFLLDLCGAGTAARLPWQVETEKPLRGWVIAACGEEEAAYDGRFTEAVIAVLKALDAGELDIDSSMPHVPLATVARAIRRELNRLAEEKDGYSQRVTATLVDISADVEPPFFPNLAYDSAERPKLRAGLDPGVLPFLDDLDEGLDARHFLERAIGLGRLTEANASLVGCFTGRDQELRRVSPWLNGDGDEGPLCVVTGSPGSGKSALLGVLVCAASPDLRDLTRQVWNRIAQRPLPLDRLAAVHARQRGIATVTASIARQLGFPENSTTAELIAALRTRAIQPVLIVDALDEADDPVTLMNELLLPLTEPDGVGNQVRLLVGVRDYSTFQPLFERAWVVDLDEVDQHVLEDDLLQYVQGLLRTTAEYRPLGAVTGAFAHEVATVLAAPDADGDRRWGPFLVAGLYTRHFLTAHAQNVITDSALAAELGRKVPSDLGGVLELDLELESDQPWLRPVLTALAHACGAGMPVSVLTRVAPIFAGEPATTAQVRSALGVARFYLRQSMDSDRSNVYRLFHQGLADTLAQPGVEVQSRVLDALLSSLGMPDRRDWNAAEPYLFRHVAAHAAAASRLEEIESDPGLLLHPDSSLALTAATGDSHAAKRVAANARLFQGISTPADLALAAVRAGRTELARRAATTAGEVPLAWQPRWSLGSKSPSLQEPRPRFRSVALSADGSVVAALIEDVLAIWRWPADGPFDAEPDKTLYCQGGDRVWLSDDGLFAVVTGEEMTWFDLRSPGTTVSFGPQAGPVRSCEVTESEVRVVTVWNEVTIFVVRTWAADYLGVYAVGRNGQAPASDRQSLFTNWVDDHPMFNLTESDVDRLSACAWGAHGWNLAVCRTDGSVAVLDQMGGDHLVLDAGLFQGVTALAFTRDDVLLVGGADGSLSLFTLDGLLIECTAVAASPIRLIVGGDRGRLAVLDHSGSAFCRDEESLEQLPFAARLFGVPDFDVQDLAIAAFVPSDGGLVVSLTDGPLMDVHLSTGVAEEIEDLFWVTPPAHDLAVTDIGGVPGLLLSCATGYRLVYENSHALVKIDAGNKWVASHFQRDNDIARIVYNGEMAEVRHEADVVLVVASYYVELGSHPGCQVVHCAYVDGRPLVFSGGSDHKVRVWDLVAGRLLDTVNIGRPVTRIGTVNGKYLIVGADGELIAFQTASSSAQPVGPR